jgi:lysylphosphatidylglycerol synthetase-like protein (DUF2156 family)
MKSTLTALYELVDSAAAASSSPAFTVHERQNYLLQHGVRPDAYFNLQQGVSHFDLPGVGFVTYYAQRGLLSEIPIIFTRPVCASEHLQRLIEAFLHKRGPRAFFIGMDHETALVLGRLGFAVNMMGVEFNIPLADYSIGGSRMKYLRTVLNNATKGIEARELRWSDVDRREVERISMAWLRGKRVSSRELRLLTRPPEFGDAWEVRKFYCFKHGRMIGYVFFDPFFRDGKVVGYTANILRSEPNLKPRGTLDFTLLTALKTFQRERVETLSLGIAPLHNLRPVSGEAVALRKMLELMYNRMGFLYNFRELAFHKTRYRGTESTVYCCKRGPSALEAAVITLRATNVI